MASSGPKCLICKDYVYDKDRRNLERWVVGKFGLNEDIKNKLSEFIGLGPDHIKDTASTNPIVRTSFDHLRKVFGWSYTKIAPNRYSCFYDGCAVTFNVTLSNGCIAKIEKGAGAYGSNGSEMADWRISAQSGSCPPKDAQNVVDIIKNIIRTGNNHSVILSCSKHPDSSKFHAQCVQISRNFINLSELKEMCPSCTIKPLEPDVARKPFEIVEEVPKIKTTCPMTPMMDDTARPNIETIPIEEKIVNYSLPNIIKSALEGNLEAVRRFIENGVDPNTTNENGRTALSFASQAGHFGVVRDLLLNGADPNIQDTNGMTALMWAIYRGHEDVVDELLTYGANPELMDSSGHTARDALPDSTNAKFLSKKKSSFFGKKKLNRTVKNGKRGKSRRSKKQNVRARRSVRKHKRRSIKKRK